MGFGKTTCDIYVGEKTVYTLCMDIHSINRIILLDSMFRTYIPFWWIIAEIPLGKRMIKKTTNYISIDSNVNMNTYRSICVDIYIYIYVYIGL